ncbi:MAG: flagellar protein FlaG [Burkholderiales bacterium]|nr:flagellar protein FlaG [Burkholderiales bacterium]MDP2399250.1 flagellar protein FlaG [Burkholderiales bacterium]
MPIDTSSVPATGLPVRAAPAPLLVPPLSAKQPASDADTGGLHDAAKAANAAIRPLSSHLEFRIDSHSGRTVVQIYDAGTRQLIRQLPSEEMLAIARALDRLQGMLIQDQA